MATSGKAQTIRFTPEDIAILEQVQKDTGLARRADALRFVLRQYAREHAQSASAPRS